MDSITMEAENPRIHIGANNPPADPKPTPFEAAEKAVTDIYGEAKLWLDGAVVDSQDLADGLGNLQAAIRKAAALADANKEIEYRPHKKAADAVSKKYNAILDKTKLASDACAEALAPWLAAKQKALDDAALKAREEAEEKARLAQEAIRSADATNLEARAEAEVLVKDAKKAATTANVAGRARATAGGMMGRAIGLRTVPVAILMDEVIAARHYWKDGRDEIIAVLQKLADRDVAAGKRSIPGFDIQEQHKAV